MRPEQERTADIVRAHDCDSSRLIAILQEIQAAESYLSEENMTLVADMLHISVSRVYSVATFYENFSLEPKGKHIIKVCDGTACHVRGAARIIDACENRLGIKAGQTTPDYRMTYEVVYCLGSCGLAPVAMIDDKVVGHLVPETTVKLLDELV